MSAIDELKYIINTIESNTYTFDGKDQMLIALVGDVIKFLEQQEIEIQKMQKQLKQLTTGAAGEY